MRSQGKWLPLFLSAAVLPGAGQWHLKKRWKGGLMMALTLLIVTGGIARYLSVVFALANLRGTQRPPHLNPFPLLAEAWRLDRQTLGILLVGLAAIWLLSILDLLFSPKEKKWP